MKYVAFNLVLLVVFALQVSAQSLLINDRIPDDLLITLKQQGAWGGTYSEMTINASGDFSYQSRGGLPVVKMPDVLSINGKRVKPPKYLKPKLSEEKLKLLIAEFEKIQFFKFGKDFPVEDEKEINCVTDVGTEAISIRINGQTKEVSDYYSCSGKRNRLLRNLAERIRGAGVWNYENGEIPENFEVWYRIATAGGVLQDFKIKANGKITETSYLTGKSKTVGKVSKQQLRELMDEFEKGVFSTFKYSPLSRNSGCSNAPAPLPTGKTRHVNIQINRVAQMYASLYENCRPQPETDAAKFEYAADAIEKLLKSVGAMKTN